MIANMEYCYESQMLAPWERGQFLGWGHRERGWEVGEYAMEGSGNST